MYLTRHFDSREFDCHSGAAVPTYAMDDLRMLCRVYLEPLREAWGPVTVVSGYRTRRYNMAVGGAPASMHVYLRSRPGAAADVTCARGDPEKWYRTLAALGPGGLGRYPGHVHVDSRHGYARW